MQAGTRARFGFLSRPAGAGLLGVILMGAIFVADVLTPLGYTGGVLYLIPVLLALWVPGPRYTLSTASAATIFILLDLAVSGQTALPAGVVLVERAGAVGVIWVFAAAIAWRKRHDAVIEHLSAIVESSDDAILGTTPEGVVTSLNAGAERLFGVSAAGVVGRPIQELLPDAARKWDEFLSRIRSGETLEQVEVRRTRADGSEVWVALRVSPVRDLDGGIAGVSAIARDITDRKEVEEKLVRQEALARLGTMAAVVAHEVKNPLAGIGGAIQVLRDRLPAGARDREILAEILERLKGLNALVQDLLDFARPRAPRFAPVPLATTLRETAALLTADPAYVHLVVEVEGPDPTLDADLDFLRDVFHNLLLNGAQATGGRGPLNVSIAVERGRARVVVRDGGPGIPAELSERVFEPFFTTKHRGTGLGLSIARRLVEAQGGTLTLSSPPGGGTAAVVELPLSR